MNLPEEIPPRWLEQIRQAFAEELDKASKNVLQNKVDARTKKIIERDVLEFVKVCTKHGTIARGVHLRLELGCDPDFLLMVIRSLIADKSLEVFEAVGLRGLDVINSMKITYTGSVYLKALEAELGEKT